MEREAPGHTVRLRERAAFPLLRVTRSGPEGSAVMH